MKRLSPNKFSKKLVLLALASLILSWTAFGQTKISMPKNKNNISKDIEVGGKASVEVEKTFPMLNDRVSDAYLNEVGMRLANAVPPEFQHREFNCRFKIVNASDINAFALPGGFTYVNRGVLTTARTEGEVAGVLAHEIAHVTRRSCSRSLAFSANQISTRPWLRYRSACATVWASRV